jgi:hypothetical protein
VPEFDEWLTEKEAAAKIGKSTRTLRVWRRKRTGPPYALFGRTVKYRKLALVEHFRAVEIQPVRPRKQDRSAHPRARTPSP